LTVGAVDRGFGDLNPDASSVLQVLFLQFLASAGLHDPPVIGLVFLGEIRGEELVIVLAHRLFGFEAQIPGVAFIDEEVAGPAILEEHLLGQVLHEGSDGALVGPRRGGGGGWVGGRIVHAGERKKTGAGEHGGTPVSGVSAGDPKSVGIGVKPVAARWSDCAR
jgi:hypothetical protein